MKTVFIIGFFFISIIGTALHFVFEYSKHNKVAALFSAVNESTWEHIKIALTPYFVWSLIDGFMYGMNNNYFLAKVVGMLVIIVFIPLLFYSYSKILKKSILVVDIIIFFVAIFLGQYVSYLVLNMKDVPFYVNYISVIVLFIIFGFYMIATLMPLKIEIFKDPTSKKYGIKGHLHHEHKKEK